MVGRDPAESHRVSTPLELLFDLCFVVAVGQAGAALHHELAQGEYPHALVSYVLVFFAIWWPWVNFTWFASAYDTDDVPYRLITFVQIAGVLVMAAGVSSAFTSLDFRVMVVGYVIMRIALVGQWVRCAIEDPASRGTALRFAAGITLVQVGWVLRIVIGPPAAIGFVAFGILGLLELVIPVFAERTGGRLTPWHPDHITERYGLFTIIVLGECVLAATTAAQAALSTGPASASLVAVAGGGIILVCALWWSYFKRPDGILEDASMRMAFAWGYGHYVIFASVAAIGAGLQLAVDSTHGATTLPPAGVALTVALPAAIYLVAAVLLHAGPAARGLLGPIGIGSAMLVLAAISATWIGVPAAVLAIGLIVAGLVAVNVATAQSATNDRVND